MRPHDRIMMNGTHDSTFASIMRAAMIVNFNT